MAYFRQSKRRTALFLEALLNQPCCPSLTVKMQTQVTAALRPTYGQLTAQLPTQDQLSIDESPTKEARSKAWLWVAVAQTFTVFGVRLTRAGTLLDEWLTEAFAGTITCDRAKMYWSRGRLQWCWAHLQRDFQALIDRGDGKTKRLGHDLMRPTRELFHHWARYRDGTITLRGLKGLQASRPRQPTFSPWPPKEGPQEPWPCGPYVARSFGPLIEAPGMSDMSIIPSSMGISPIASMTFIAC